MENTGAIAVRLLSALVMKPALRELADTFAHDSGHKLAIAYDAAAAVDARIRGGESCDVAILQKPAMEALLESGEIAAGSVVILARSGVAMAVRAGAPKPDIGSPAAVGRALLAAQSVAYDDPAMGHASGIHFRRVLERLGIAAAVDARARLMPRGLAEFASRDTADCAVTQPMEILAASGYQLVGWLPPELQDVEGFTWAAGINANARHPEAGQTLIRFLASPAAAAVIEEKGMVPAAL